MTRLPPLRRRLFLLVSAAILPLAAVSGFALYTVAQQQREQAERSALGLARALTTAVDAEIDRSMAVINSLAAARALREDNLLRFHATGYGLAMDRRRTAEAGFDLHLVKPVDHEKLEEALRA